jgi:cytidylate kinase
MTGDKTTASPPAPKAKTLRVAIDGPAGAGKSTVARRVADALGYAYVDTGAMYRALAWAVLDAGIEADEGEAVCALAERLDVRLEAGGRVLVDGRDVSGEIRTPQISSLTSPLSALPCVRTRMVALQQAMARRDGVVMEGRDIGTVVLPDAEVKVFLVASLGERVRRRREELTAAGYAPSAETLTRDMADRDARDAARDVAPMRAAPDAVTLDSDSLTVEAVVTRILALCADAEGRHGE